MISYLLNFARLSNWTLSLKKSKLKKYAESLLMESELCLPALEAIYIKFNHITCCMFEDIYRIQARDKSHSQTKTT